MCFSNARNDDRVFYVCHSTTQPKPAICCKFKDRFERYSSEAWSGGGQYVIGDEPGSTILYACGRAAVWVRASVSAEMLPADDTLPRMLTRLCLTRDDGTENVHVRRTPEVALKLSNVVSPNERCRAEDEVEDIKFCQSDSLTGLRRCSTHPPLSSLAL
jgi:hypothetical protein